MEVIIRSLKDLKKVLYDRPWAKTAPGFVVYRVRRGVRTKNRLRYDETTLLPRRLGREFPKTFGHEHPPQYTELMKVRRGQAVFLLQKDEGKIIQDAYFCQAKAGQAVISPPGYSHVTINPTKKVLKIGTWLSESCPSSYENIKKMAGAGYFLTEGGWRKNKNYSKISKLKEKKPLSKVPQNLNFLKPGGC